MWSPDDGRSARSLKLQHTLTQLTRSAKFSIPEEMQAPQAVSHALSILARGLAASATAARGGSQPVLGQALRHFRSCARSPLHAPQSHSGVHTGTASRYDEQLL
jgi:hypothetical protein